MKVTCGPRIVAFLVSKGTLYMRSCELYRVHCPYGTCASSSFKQPVSAAQYVHALHEVFAAALACRKQAAQGLMIATTKQLLQFRAADACIHCRCSPAYGMQSSTPAGLTQLSR